MNRLKLFTVVVLCALSSSGCLLAVGAGAGAGGVVYYKGNLKETLPHSSNAVFDASLKALSDEALLVDSQKQDPYRGEIKSEYPDGKNIWITITALGHDTCELKIRVGAGGDQKRANQLLVRIKEHLRKDVLL